MNKMFNPILTTLEMFLGTAMTAAAFGLVIIPQGFAAGGVTGFARIVSNSIGTSLSVTVKLTRTLAIIPITLCLAYVYGKNQQNSAGRTVSIRTIFPFFILYFIAASIITTIAIQVGISASVFAPVKTLSKFFIVLAMAAIGLNTNIVKLIKTGGTPLLLGACCWIGITIMSILMQYMLNIW